MTRMRRTGEELTCFRLLGEELALEFLVVEKPQVHCRQINAFTQRHNAESNTSQRATTSTSHVRRREKHTSRPGFPNQPLLSRILRDKDRLHFDTASNTNRPVKAGVFRSPENIRSVAAVYSQRRSAVTEGLPPCSPIIAIITNVNLARSSGSNETGRARSVRCRRSDTRQIFPHYFPPGPTFLCRLQWTCRP